MMSVQKRGSNWCFRVEEYDEVKEKQVHRRIGKYTTKAEAKKAEARYLAKLDTLEFTTITMNDLFNLYIKDKSKKVKDTTIYDIKKKYRLHIEPMFGSTKLYKIDKISVQKFQEYLIEKKYKNSQLKNLQTQLSALLKFAIKHEYIDRNPFDILGYVSNNEKQEEMKFFTLDEYKQFEISLLNSSERFLYTDALITLYWTGMRCGELQALTWKDFRGDCLYIHSTYDNKLGKISETTKTRKNRYVYLNDVVIELLKRRKSEACTYADFDDAKYIFGYYDVFSHRSISNIKNTAIDKYNKKAKAKLPAIRIHDLRHSHASLLINTGWSSFEVANRLGNTPSQIEKTYAHMFKSTQVEMAKSLNQFPAKQKKLPKITKKLPKQ